MPTPFDNSNKVLRIYAILLAVAALVVGIATGVLL